MENYNILFIFSDQHRACDLGCYGNKQVVSPNFDRLSERSFADVILFILNNNHLINLLFVLKNLEDLWC